KTLQSIIPSAALFTPRGSFAGYASAGSPAAVLVANQYGGLVDAHSLLRFNGFPTVIEYTQGTVKRDTAFTYGPGTLVAVVDSAASVVAPTTLRFYRAGQKWDAATATWTIARDTGVVVPWTQPGGSLGPLLGSATWTPSAAGDSVTLALDSLAVAQMADSTFPGLVITTDQPGALVQLRSFVLRTRVHPAKASPDTAIAQTISTGIKTYIFNPEPPRATHGELEVGGIRSARSIFELSLDQQVPACAPPATCGTLPLKSVAINSVELLLRPATTIPSAFASLDSVALTLRTVDEPELGRVAPLGGLVDARTAYFHRGDTLVAVPLTSYAATQIARDSLHGAFALISEPAGNTFGAVWFEPAPRLRITYTLPPAPRLP
ncbi:MAG TPA: hypothetical protein VFH27_07950, partial [Longimicrobiaceae bacterium]|nr:hypothetical protein [Longimicrobiaceae bacterium]